MKKIKLLAMFLISAVIGLSAVYRADMGSSKAREELKDGGSRSANSMYVKNSGSSFTRFRSDVNTDPKLIAEDINFVRNRIGSKTIYVRDYSMYQRLKMAGAYDITNNSDDIVQYVKNTSGMKIYMVRF